MRILKMKHVCLGRVLNVTEVQQEVQAPVLDATGLVKLYVGNLMTNVNEKMLLEAFKKFGEIKEAVIMRHGDSGDSRGFGFITFANPASAKHAADQASIRSKGRAGKSRVGPTGGRGDAVGASAATPCP